MNLLHATWLPAKRNLAESCGDEALFLWADTWKVTEPSNFFDAPALHPYSLTSKALREWLIEKNMLPEGIVDAEAFLTLPSKALAPKKNH